MSAADVVIAGGGPAGLATAIRCREHGMSVVVLDRGAPSHDKACGEGLMPRAVAQLRELGLALDPPEFAKVRGVRFVQDDAVAEAVFRDGEGMVARRPALHARLADRARDCGADLRFGARVTGLASDGVATADGVVRARFVVGADGLHSRVRDWAGLAAPARGPVRHGQRRHHRLAPWTDLVEVWWADGAEAYVAPLPPGTVGVAILWSGGPARYDDLLARFPKLRDRLLGAAVVSHERGAGPFRRRVRGVVRGRVALVGDASGYVDAITGEGVGLALEQAHALARAMAGDDLASYAREHARIGRVPALFARGMVRLASRPALRRAALRALAARPRAFESLLALASGSRRDGASGAGARAGAVSRA